jgi:hypothetical protein
MKKIIEKFVVSIDEEPMLIKVMLAVIFAGSFFWAWRPLALIDGTNLHPVISMFIMYGVFIISWIYGGFKIYKLFTHKKSNS